MIREVLLKNAKPILFNTDMVRAILDGRKTVARQIVKPQPAKDMIYKLGYCTDGDKKDIGKFGFSSNECGGKILFVKPPCKPGDILYVRETWSEWTDGYVYRAWVSPFPQVGCYQSTKWHPSIHMPKEAARIFLKVKDVRVERLQDITKEDIKKEGIYDDNTYPTDRSINAHPMTQGGWTVEAYKDRFKMLWNFVIKKADLAKYGWDANPWVWVIEFERVEE